MGRAKMFAFTSKSTKKCFICLPSKKYRSKKSKSGRTIYQKTDDNKNLFLQDSQILISAQSSSPEESGIRSHSRDKSLPSPLKSRLRWCNHTKKSLFRTEKVMTPRRRRRKFWNSLQFGVINHQRKSASLLQLIFSLLNGFLFSGR